MYAIDRRELVWTNCSAGTAVAPDAPNDAWDADIRDVGAETDDLSVQIDTTAVLHTAASVDLNFTVGMIQADHSIKWDTVVTQAITAVGDGVVQTYAITARGDRIKVSLDNNTGASKAYVTATVRIRRRRF
jgi:hypothetical protein